MIGCGEVTWRDGVLWLVQVSVERFCPDTDTWRVCRKLPGGNRSQHAAVKLGGKILVSGGLDR